MTYEQHLRKAKECEECLDYLLKSRTHWTWAVVVAGYAALHYVDAIIDIIPTCRFDPHSHETRARVVASHPDLRRNLVRFYGPLKSSAYCARYKARTWDRGVVDRDILPKLEKIKNYYQSVLNRHTN